MNRHESFMRRCFDLAKRGRGRASPNPLVGALLEYEGRILSEGYHHAFGQAHAEVNAIDALPQATRHLLTSATMYVSLEPCCFFGKTPPCTRRILAEGIPRVVISCLDNSPQVSGQGVAQLRAAGVEVVTGVLEREGLSLNRARRVFVREERPYVILKFARSRNGMFGLPGEEQAWISNPASRRLVHRWRAEADAILVGTRTARIDDPELTTRYYAGPSPLRIVLDRRRSLPDTLKLFQGPTPTLRVTERPAVRDRPAAGVEELVMPFAEAFLRTMLRHLHDRRIGVLLVEGGRTLLQSFLDQGLWDEARVLTGATVLPPGLPAPAIHRAPQAHFRLGSDRIDIYRNYDR